MYLAGHEHTLELHTDSCATAVAGRRLPPAAANRVGRGGEAAARQQLRSWRTRRAIIPELTTYYAKGLIWGYVHLTLEQDAAVARVITTPNDGSGTNVLGVTHRYAAE